MWSTVLSCLIAGLATVNAISPISVKGSKFFTSDGNQFFIKGIAYQLTPDDPLIDDSQCQLDAALMKTLGANTIRVYHVDASGDHKACMSTFADAGIYLFVDLDTFTTQIEQEAPHWNQSQLSAFEAVMDEFQQYNNTAGFFVGNEVLTTGNGSIAAPYVKAAARDVKAYRNSKNYRNIPVGYSAADISSLRPMLQNYFACGTNASEALDFFSLNAYEWCGTASSYEISGYSQLTANVTDYNIPIFLSETGCIKPRPRTFQDQAAIFGDKMTPYWSGAIIYEWIEEENDYGLVSYGQKVDPTASGAPPDGYTRSGTPTPVSPDFSYLSNQWKTLTPSGVMEANYNPTLTPPPCPAYTSGVWEVNGGVALPTLGQTYNAAIQSSITKGAAAGTGSASAATPTKTGAASPGREVRGMGIGLVGVLVGFFWWL
ncbi:glycoside hydrolase family 72 protein [Lepidopterella palustris CBS 459.81]|uniref:1,3-beta-glucanosyltransferase n=1 Tax=Lepidopterella palustris CBS 459.81 TaxID=1314670 RepID=A0A8E2JBC2_9PEZI|nr:glycoside hydrolase family 72 protein [Lepidopterella palustris CBS 459.81]